jgi:RNA polymerase sigma-70 factor (sigma-E family)
VSGPDEDFESFVQAEGRRLFGLARVLCGNEHDAWDLLQDSLARVGDRWASVRNKTDPRAYARRTLVNLNLNRLRRLRRELLVATPPEPRRSGRDDGPDLEWLDEALARLSPRQRTVVTLAYVDGLPLADVADILNCSVSTAKTHLARGRDALRRAAPEQATLINTAPNVKDTDA